MKAILLNDLIEYATPGAHKISYNAYFEKLVDGANWAWENWPIDITKEAHSDFISFLKEWLQNEDLD